ncbi:MAG TPA: SpoIIE family protein phosphatase [Patescibacteria group bacterium]|nr:SpoIIE family protein phosphatase [Patescibacteria group bacterium]
MKIALRDKFAIPVILFSLFFSLGQGFWEYSQVKEKAKAEFSQKNTLMMDLASMGLGLSLWEYNLAAIRAGGEAIFQDPEVASVVITIVNLDTKTESVLFQGGKNTREYQDPGMVIMERQVMQQGQKIGTLTVTFTEMFRNEQLQRELVIIAGQNLLILLMLWGIIFLVAQRVSRPITKLAKTMSCVADGETMLGDDEFPRTGQDGWPREIRQLYTAFEKMTDKIQTSLVALDVTQEELRKVNEELEQKVDERTQELFAANQMLIALNEEILAVNDELQNANQALNVEIENRCRTEKRLAVGEEQYRRLFEEMISGAVLCEVIYDNQGQASNYRLLQANRAFERLTGLAVREKVGMQGRDLGFLWSPAFIRKCYRVAEDGGQQEYEHYSRDLDRYYEVKIFSPQTGQFAMLFQDISGRKKMEDGLMQAKEELEIRVEERTAALHRAKAMLENEVTLAANVQRGLLPRSFDDLLLSVRAIYSPYYLVSGDSYDYAWSQEHKRFSGFVLDVSGHGVASSLQAIVVSTYFRDVLNSPMRLPAKLNWINHHVLKYFSEDTYAAAIYFEADFRHRTLSFVTAGIYGFLAGCQALPVMVKKEGSFIGLDENPEYQEWTVPFRPGDTFYFISDGLWDQVVKRDLPCPTGNFEQMIGLLGEMASNPWRRDDCSALCLRISDHPIFPVRFAIDRPGEYERIRSRIRALLGKVAGTQADMVDIVLGEALNNGMKESMNATVKISLLGSLLVIRVRDGGQGFAGNEWVAGLRRNSVEEAFEKRLYEENGRGILIMVSWMDRVLYNRHGNEVMLVKRLAVSGTNLD